MYSGNNGNKEFGVRFCGIGGMGVVLTSIIFGKSAIYDNKFAIQTQSYGAEQRGTKVKSDVVISKSEIVTYPMIEKADALIAFSQESFDYYVKDITDDCVIIINSNLIQCNDQKNHLYKIPANDIATELKNKRGANMVILGALGKITKLVSKESLIKAISDSVSKPSRDINISTFQKGYDTF